MNYNTGQCQSRSNVITVNIPGIGWYNEGAGVAVCNVDIDTGQETLDMIIMAYEDSPEHSSNRYQDRF